MEPAWKYISEFAPAAVVVFATKPSFLSPTLLNKTVSLNALFA